MIAERDLWDAIKEIEALPDSYGKCQKLATYYTLLNFLYPEEQMQSFDAEPQEMIGDYGTSEFYSAIRNQEAKHVWSVMDELMTTLQVVFPRLYEGVLRKLNT